MSNDILTDDGIWIRGGFSDGSGVQQRGGLHGYSYSLYVSAHEYGHHLFGSGHIFGVSNLALMTGGPVWNAIRGMISWERERMNWISYTDKSTDGTVNLTDYMTTDLAYQIPVSTTE